MYQENVEAEDEFQDAYEVQPPPCPMDLESAIKEAKTAVDLFFNDKVDEARNLLEPLKNVSMYHALGTSVFTFMEAILTFEPKSIENASEALKQCIVICNQYRKKSSLSESLGKIVKKANYDSYTPEEVHAELCYAESLLLKAVLTFIEDETLVSFIKAGFKIRSCLSSYRECSHILHNRNWTNNCHKVHFESGVRMGIGAFNLMISLLPQRIIKLLEFIGFSGSKEHGLKELEIGYNLNESLRRILCITVLLGYNLFVLCVLSHTDGDINTCDQILNNQLQLYPDGAWFLFFKGRLEFMKCNIKESIEWYNKSWKAQQVWPQFHHLCFWELMFTNSIEGNWREAATFAEKLVNDSRWSKTMYMYQEAVMLLMLKDLSDDEKQKVEELLTNAPKHKQRIAGKSIPMEKFVVKRCERYFNQNNTLVLPAYEIQYLWNMFKIIGKKWNYIESIFIDADKTIERLKTDEGSTYYHENLALALLIKGSCLRYMKSPLQAEECLKHVIKLENKIIHDTYLVPYATVELALVFLQENNLPKATQLLETAKKNYTGYSLESRLHFKIHSALTEIENKK